MIGTTLYKKDSKSKVREWTAFVTGSIINVQHGLVDGQLQTELTQCSPKNVGRSNETTAEQQAVLECSALYSKKIERDGYKVNLSDEDTKVEVTLALDASKVGHRIPEDKKLWCSYKIDGGRSLWRPGFGLQSRKGTKYSVAHIEEALKDCPHILDGELYIVGQPLNRVLSAIKKPNEMTHQLEFHVFDIVSPDTFEKRYQAYEKAVKEINHPQIKAVEQVLRMKSELKETHDYYVKQGWEGLMCRINDYPYEHRRSPSLFKLKEFQEDEFLVTGVEVDKTGQGVLVCGEFKARMRGDDSLRIHQAENPHEYIGRKVTIRFQNYSSAGITTSGGIPIFPVAIAFRDDV